MEEKNGGAVSRFLFLNLSFIFATYPPASDGPPSSAGIFGLAGPDTVPAACRQTASWALTPRFHPYRRKKKKNSGGSFLLQVSEDYSPLRFPQTGALPCADFPQPCGRDRSSHHFAAKIRHRPGISKWEGRSQRRKKKSPGFHGDGDSPAISRSRICGK